MSKEDKIYCFFDDFFSVMEEVESCEKDYQKKNLIYEFISKVYNTGYCDGYKKSNERFSHFVDEE